MAVRGGWRPLSGLIFEIVNSVGQGNFTFVREKSGKSQGISNTYGCGNHFTDPRFVSLIFIAATRETAFLHAISVAAITHELTVQCRQNRIPGCRCGKTREQQKGKSDWQWGGCSDDIKFGEKETKRFIDKLEKGNDARTAFNLHNNHVGRKVGLINCLQSVQILIYS